MVAVAGAAIVVAALAGCSSNKSSTTSNKSSTTSTSSSSLGAGQANVVVDYDAAQNVQAHCSTVVGSVTIQLGTAAGQAYGGPTGVGLTTVLTDGDPPGVKSVDGIANGKTLGYDEGFGPGPRPTATKEGSTYKITGNATGKDTLGANPMQTMSWPFEIDVNCS
jgi:ipoprotein LpqH